MDDVEISFEFRCFATSSSDPDRSSVHGDCVVCRRGSVSLIAAKRCGASVGSTGPYGRLERLRASKINSKVDISVSVLGGAHHQNVDGSGGDDQR